MTSSEAIQPPAITVVIATNKRVHLVEDLLQSLQTARHEFKGQNEVIVVDDSPPPEAGQISEICNLYNARLVTAGPKVTAKRNCGANAGQHEILLFLDSDCRATSGLLGEHAKLYASPDIDAVLGLVEFV